jgi:DNA-directed RNA polymerase subunit omega
VRSKVNAVALLNRRLAIDKIPHFLLYCRIMIFPLEELIEYDKNMYEITSAASRRSYQLSMLYDKDRKEEYDGKMAALAARQVFTQEVEFRLETE